MTPRPTARQRAFLTGADRYGWRSASWAMALSARACVRAGWAKDYPTLSGARTYRITDKGRRALD